MKLPHVGGSGMGMVQRSLLLALLVAMIAIPALSVAIAETALTATPSKSVYAPGEWLEISGKATPGATVTIKVLNPNGVLTYATAVVAGSDGSFSAKLFKFPEEPTSLVPFGEYTIKIKDTASGQEITVKITFGSVALLSGVVVDETGLRIPRAEVWLISGSEIVKIVETNGRGEFEASVTPGTYLVKVLKSGYMPVTKEVTLGEGETKQIEIEIKSFEYVAKELENVKANLTALSQEIENTLKSIESSIEKLSDKVDTVTGSLEALSSNISKLEAKLEELSKALSTVSSEISTKVTDEISKLRTELEDLKKAIEDVKNSVSSDTAKLSKKIDGIVTAIGNLKSSVDAMSDSLAKVLSAVADLKNDVSNVKRDVSTVAGKIGRLDEVYTKLSNVDSKVSEIDKKVDAMSSDIEKSLGSINNILTLTIVVLILVLIAAATSIYVAVQIMKKLAA